MSNGVEMQDLFNFFAFLILGLNLVRLHSLTIPGLGEEAGEEGGYSHVKTYGPGGCAAFWVVFVFCKKSLKSKHGSHF